MSEIQSQVQEHKALSPRRSANGRTPPGYRVLHVIVPEQIFNHVKAQAYISGLRFPEYVAKFLEEACPYKVDRWPQTQTSTAAHETVQDGMGHP